MATSVPADLTDVIANAQATTIVGIGNMFGMTADRQSSIFLKHADEPNVMETVAARQAMYREAPIGRE
jgi:hypothetical protein